MSMTMNYRLRVFCDSKETAAVLLEVYKAAGHKFDPPSEERLKDDYRRDALWVVSEGGTYKEVMYLAKMNDEGDSVNVDGDTGLLDLLKHTFIPMEVEEIVIGDYVDAKATKDSLIVGCQVVSFEEVENAYKRMVGMRERA